MENRQFSYPRGFETFKMGPKRVTNPKGKVLPKHTTKYFFAKIIMCTPCIKHIR